MKVAAIKGRYEWSNEKQKRMKDLLLPDNPQKRDEMPNLQLVHAQCYIVENAEVVRPGVIPKDTPHAGLVNTHYDKCMIVEKHIYIFD